MSEPVAVGIDLGTTHCAAFQSRRAESAERLEGSLDCVRLTQLVGRDRTDALPLLPSFLYAAPAIERLAPLPWATEAAGQSSCEQWAIGAYARSRAAETPGRVVGSSKSWLSQPDCDRHAPLLPVAAEDGVARLSPVEASRLLLVHVAQAWANGQSDAGPGLATQDVTLTVPASFDAAARELTVEAARAAGLERLTLLEEPQAAFYAWLEREGDAWRSQLSVGDVVAVVDVGGGTTDLAAILLCDDEGRLEPRRIAVGEHILLGGDNMDLALAHVARQKLEAAGKKLDSWQLVALSHAARTAKETLLSDSAPHSTTVVVPSRGSQLLGGSLRCELLRGEVESYLVDGFFPQVELDREPVRRRRAALRARGLGYADDPAVTAHLAAFLRAQRGAQGGDRAMLCPTHVLFNGGVFKSQRLRERVMSTLNQWLLALGAPVARELAHDDYELAVARGAAYYGLARQGQGVRVRGGTAQAYYVGVESPAPAVPGMEPPSAALCVAPFGMEEETEVLLTGAELMVVVGESVQFRFFGSTVRREDGVGDLIDDPDAVLEELSPIAIELPAEGRRAGELVEVTLRAVVTEVGTLSLLALPLEPRFEGEQWRVDLNVRQPRALDPGAPAVPSPV